MLIQPDLKTINICFTKVHFLQIWNSLLFQLCFSQILYRGVFLWIAQLLTHTEAATVLLLLLTSVLAVAGVLPKLNSATWWPTCTLPLKSHCLHLHLFLCFVCSLPRRHNLAKCYQKSQTYELMQSEPRTSNGLSNAYQSFRSWRLVPMFGLNLD